jgi:spermidine synthase
MEDGRVIPQIGFFEEDYPYPAVLEGGREWMTLMPNETNTTKPALDAARGKVLTYGLGLGYFAYMASIKDEVTSVTVVERSEDAIALFKEHILPQFPDPQKVTVVHSDAFEFAEKQMENGAYDMVFTDLWHDPSDGVELYLKMKEYENELPNAHFVYWIGNTLKLYM